MEDKSKEQIAKAVYECMQMYADQQTTALKDECERLRDALEYAGYWIKDAPGNQYVMEKITNALNKTE